MAIKSTIFKANVAIADIDHGYYADHALTLARHPSELTMLDVPGLRWSRPNVLMTRRNATLPAPAAAFVAALHVAARGR